MVNNLKQHCAIFRVFQNRVTNIPSAATIRNASKKNTYTLITLCTYAQQGYAFGPVGLCICVCVAKKTGCLRSYRLENSRWCNLLLVHRV